MVAVDVIHSGTVGPLIGILNLQLLHLAPVAQRLLGKAADDLSAARCLPITPLSTHHNAIATVADDLETARFGPAPCQVKALGHRKQIGGRFNALSPSTGAYLATSQASKRRGKASMAMIVQNSEHLADCLDEAGRQRPQ